METNDTTIRVLIADDQILFADNLKLMLETLAQNITVIGIAYDGGEAVGMVDSLEPDIILMDVRMPGMDGVQATKTIRLKHPDQKIIMLTTFDDDTYVEAALIHGAVGYLLKNIKPNDLIMAINAVATGSILLSPDLVVRLLKHSDAGQPSNDPETESMHSAIATMSNREKEILNLIAKGYSNKKIAETVFLSEPTVRNYISAIYAKLGSKDRLEVMSIARKNIGNNPPYLDS